MSTVVTGHSRPGVYSDYEASGVVTAALRRGWGAMVAQSAKGEAGKVYEIGSYSQAVQAFGAGDPMTALVQGMLANGAARVLAVPAGEDYEGAFALLQGREGLKVVACDSDQAQVQQKLRESVAAASAERKERVGVVCGGAGETVSQLTARAQGLNSERMVLVAPGISEEAGGALVAAAVAGAICGEADPALPLGGALLRGVPGLEQQFSESDVDALIQAGVTPVEMVGGRCAVIRGVTTRTKTGSSPDETWRELTTILVVDDVIPAVRKALAARFHRAKNTAQVRGAVRSQVILELERKKAAEIITGYGEVTAQPLEGDPSVCLVEFGFTVAHGLDQIWLRAQITV